MFTNWKREREIRTVLAGLARQRVAIVARPSNIWVIERALGRNDRIDAALATCLMRGWVEPLHENMPCGDLDPKDLSGSPPPFTRTEIIYRLTEGGWAALNRAHAWTVAGIVIPLFSLVIAVMS